MLWGSLIGLSLHDTVGREGLANILTNSLAMAFVKATKLFTITSIVWSSQTGPHKYWWEIRLKLDFDPY